MLIASSSEAGGRKISSLHRQSLRRIEKLRLHALDSCRALGRQEAMQSLLEGRSVLASSSTVPVDVSSLSFLG